MQLCIVIALQFGVLALERVKSEFCVMLILKIIRRNMKAVVDDRLPKA